MGRLFGLRAPIPACLAAATLPVPLRDVVHDLGRQPVLDARGRVRLQPLARALARRARAVRPRACAPVGGRRRARCALSVTLAAHVLPWLWALGGIALLVVVDLAAAAASASATRVPGDPKPAAARRALRSSSAPGVLSAALSAWWLVPVGDGPVLAISMGYVNDGAPGPAVLRAPALPERRPRDARASPSSGSASAWAQRSRFGVWLTTLTALSAAALRARPPGVAVERAPVAVLVLRRVAHLRLAVRRGRGLDSRAGGASTPRSAGSPTSTRALRRRRPSRAARRRAGPRRSAGRSRAGAGRGGRRAAADDLARPAVAAHRRSGSPQGPNEVPVWSAYNYTGYQGVARLVRLRQGLGRVPRGHPDDGARGRATHGCGQSMWEYDPSESDFGTTESLMLLPYWTNNCIGSHGGAPLRVLRDHPVPLPQPVRALAAAVGPHGRAPVRAVGRPDVALGLRHLQLLGVRYFLALLAERSSRAAIRSGLVTPLATTGPWHWTDGARNDADVAPLRGARRARGRGLHGPARTSSTGSARGTPGSPRDVAWWLHPQSLGRLPRRCPGPPSWPRSASRAPRRRGLTTSTARAPHARAPAARRARATSVGVSTVSFHVSRDRRPGRRARELLPALARERGDGPVAGEPEPDGGRPDLARRHRSPTAATPRTEVGVAVTLAAIRRRGRRPRSSHGAASRGEGTGHRLNHCSCCDRSPRVHLRDTVGSG